MSLIYNCLFPAMWISYFTYWLAISRNVKATERSESGPSRLVRMVAILGAIAFLWPPAFPSPG